MNGDEAEQCSNTVSGPARFAIFAALAGLGLLTLAHILARPVEANEHMYIAASVLAMDHSLYRDFAYVQMPYLAKLYALLFQATGTEHYLLTARIFTWVVMQAGIICVGGIAWRYRRDVVLAIAAMITFACSESILLITGECSNYALSSFLSLAAMWLFVCRRSHFAMAGVGALLGLSVCIKLYYAVLVPGCLIAVIFRPGEKQDRVKQALWFVGGVAISVLPAFWMLVADPDRFMFNNLGLHRLKAEVYQQNGYDDRMTLHQRIQHGKSVLQHASQMWILYAVILALFALYRNRRRLRDQFDLLLALSAACICLLTALTPIPAWSQYFAMPVPFFLVIAIILAANQKQLGTTLMSAVAAAGLFVSGPYYARAVAATIGNNGVTPIVVHDQSRALVQQIASASGSDRPLIATTRTLFALEGGARIYPQWAGSGFLFELTDQLSDTQIDTYQVTAPRTFPELLRQRPPDAIMTTVAGNDQSIADYAQNNGYQKIESSELGVLIWLPPR